MFHFLFSFPESHNIIQVMTQKQLWWPSFAEESSGSMPRSKIQSCFKNPLYLFHIWSCYSVNRKCWPRWPGTGWQCQWWGWWSCRAGRSGSARSCHHVCTVITNMIEYFFSLTSWTVDYQSLPLHTSGCPPWSSSLVLGSTCPPRRWCWPPCRRCGAGW